MSRGLDLFLTFTLAGVLGFAFGMWLSRDVVNQFADREAMRLACIEGNDRACRIYELDHGSRGL